METTVKVSCRKNWQPSVDSNYILMFPHIDQIDVLIRHNQKRFMQITVSNNKKRRRSIINFTIIYCMTYLKLFFFLL